jgi:hypothetical protein
MGTFAYWIRSVESNVEKRGVRTHVDLPQGPSKDVSF